MAVVGILKRNRVRMRTRGEALKLAFSQGRMKRGGLFKEKAPNWKGGRIHHHKGYIAIHSSLRKPSGGPKYIYEHVLVWEKAHGKVPQGWHVHHINGVKSDNRLENLVALSARDHARVFAIHQKRIRDLEEELEGLRIELSKHEH